MNEVRVLHIYRTYFPETQGGMQEAIRQLCLATQPLGVVNSVFALARAPGCGALDLPEAHLVRARSWLEVASCDMGGLAAFRRCRAAADGCDIIQIHYPWPFADVLLPFIRRRQQPVVVTYVSDIVRQRGLDQLYAPLRRRLLNSASCIVASTPNYAASSAVLRAYTDKVVCIPHCLGEAVGSDCARHAFYNKAFGQKFFLFVGVLRYYKGLDYLLAAASLMDAVVVVAGDGPESERLRRLARVKGLKNVHFLGQVSDADKYALFALCRAVVLPSHLRSEAFGMTLLEGARAAKPLVCCEIGSGMSWVNLHDETGLVVPGADAVALAHALNRLAQDDALCARLGQGAYARWQKCFAPGVVGGAYRALYDELLAA